MIYWVIKKETFPFNENRKKERELSCYGVVLENQIYYNHKTEYIFLIEEYLTINFQDT